MVTGSRYFVRCATCLSVSAIEEPPRAAWACGVCGGPLEAMGRVERNRLVRDEHLCPCDDRCTFARGPHCDCHCGGKNHGSKLVVHVVRDCSPVPIITPSTGREDARRRAEEYRSARTALLAQLDPLLEARRTHRWLSDSDYRRLRALQTTNQKAAQAREHRARMRAFRAVGIEPTTTTARDDRPIVAALACEQMTMF